jgi:hypothetical protein
MFPLVTIPAVLFAGAMTAAGVSYFFGDSYLDQWVTSLGSGPILAIAMIVASLIILALICVHTGAFMFTAFTKWFIAFLTAACLLWLLASVVFTELNVG